MIGRVEDGTPCVLHAFSGKAGRADGLAQCLLQHDIQCREVDTIIHARRHDLLSDDVYERLLALARSGRFVVAVLGVPCSTFSAARIGGDGVDAPAPVRGRRMDLRDGLRNLTDMQQREVDNANELVTRSVAIARAVVRAGGDVLFENPCDRGGVDDEDSVVRNRFRAEWGDHAPLWLHPQMVALRSELGLGAVTFPQCALGGDFQKWTTLWFSAGLRDRLRRLSACTCRHVTHRDVARGRGLQGRWHSAEAAAYPAQMNQVIADAINDVVETRRRLGEGFSNVVNAWLAVDRGGSVDTRVLDNASSGVVGSTQVHVWERHEMAACDEELEAWERPNGQGTGPRMRCGGDVVDWDLLREIDGQPGTSPCKGSCNPAHWWWCGTMTDRSSRPVLLADINTHIVYFMHLSRLFQPMRTLQTGAEAMRGARVGHTTWVDLLMPEAVAQREFAVSRVVADRMAGDVRLFRVRWEGFDSSWDTEEREDTLQHVAALSRYLEEGPAVVGDASHDAGDTGATAGLNMLCKVRGRMLANRVGHGVQKLTAHKWDSVLADAEPLGMGRCRKEGPLKGICTACACLLRTRVYESCRHAHLECPFTVRVLALIYRCAIHVSATNLAARQSAATMSDAEIVEQHKLLLVTGYRLRDDARGSAAKRTGDTPLCVIVAETHAALGDRRKRAENGWETWHTFAWHEHTLYADIHRRMTTHIWYSQQEAKRLQVKRRIDNPGKLLDKEGPWFDWEKAWVKSGWATRSGVNLMPSRASDVLGSSTTRTCTPWAWRVHAGLQLYWWYRGGTMRDDPNPRRMMMITRNVSLITEDSLVLYMDGSHDSRKPQAVAGFGFSGVRGGNGDDDMDARVVVAAAGPVVIDAKSAVFLGATRHTNNTGELTGLIESIRWALECDTRKDTAVLLRPDSELAIGWTIGDLAAGANAALVQTAQRYYADLMRQRGGRVYWQHVKGHSGHIRNDHVDALATEGAGMKPWEAIVPRADWLSVRGDGELLHNQGGWYGYNATIETQVLPEVRGGGWVIRQTIKRMTECAGWVIRPGQPPTDVHNAKAVEVNAVVRVERAAQHDPFGVLNLMPYRSTRIAHVTAAGSRVKQSIQVSVNATGERRGRAAVALVDQAMARLSTDAGIRAEIDMIDGQNMETRMLRCPIDVDLLEEFARDPRSMQRHAVGTTHAGRTMRATTQQLLRSVTQTEMDDANAVERDSLGRTWVRLDYQYSRLGTRMVASGHVLTARESAGTRADPFKFGRAIRYLALHEYGDEYDDSSCYPTSLAAICPLGRDLAQRFIANKRAIYSAVGDFYFPNIDADTKAQRIKTLNLRLDFDGSITKWERENGILPHATLMQRGCRVQVPGETELFDFRAYVTGLRARTEWIASRVPEMVQLARQTSSSRSDRPEVTAKSMVCQECEGISRDAKVDYCQTEGHWVFSKQHDGVGAGAMEGTSDEALRAALEHASTAALGYAQRVECKTMPAVVARPKVPWTRQMPYGTKRYAVPVMMDGNISSSAAVDCLGQRNGPAAEERWMSDIVVIAEGRQQNMEWEREVRVSTWDEAVIARMRMDFKRDYMHLRPRPGSHGDVTASGDSTQWIARP